MITKWHWVPTEDEEITCILCLDAKCTHETTRRSIDRCGSKRTVTIGIHERCVDANKPKETHAHRRARESEESIRMSVRLNKWIDSKGLGLRAKGYPEMGDLDVLTGKRIAPEPEIER